MQRGLLAFLAIGLLLWFAGAARAATLTVTKTTDSDDGSCTMSLCSLRDALKYASAGDTVVVPANASHYAVTLGEIPITVAPLTIQGGGASSTVIDASGGSSRVIHVSASPTSSQTISISGVTITGGKATTYPGGGGILVDFVSNAIQVNLALNGAIVTVNTSTVAPAGGDCCAGGGGIYNDSGSVSLTSSQVTDNQTTVTASTDPSNGGGGINSEGTVTVTASEVNNNSATVSQDTPVSTLICCDGGGGIYEQAFDIDVQSGSQVSNNTVTVTGPATDALAAHACCSGGGGLYNDSDVTNISNSTLDGNSVTTSIGQADYGGGAVYDDGGGGTITASTLSNNTANVTGPSGTSGANSHCCSGGGALAAPLNSGPWTITNSTFDSNTANVNAGDCCQGGGAINHEGKYALTVVGTTISNNRSMITTASGPTESGGGGLYQSEQSGPHDSFTNSTISDNSTNVSGLVAQGGGGIYTNTNTAKGTPTPDVLANVTIAGNSAPSALGGGIYTNNTQVEPKNSIIALNSAAVDPDCYATGSGTFTSLGYNLEDSPDTCSFTATGDKVVPGSSVGLGPLANNGGPTQTRALLAGSPAIDAGNPAGCTDPSGALLTTDQRGFSRPFGPRCDIGAFEFRPSAAVAPSCTLKAKSNKVLLHPKKKQKKLKGRLQLVLVCNQAASVTLSGKLVVKSGKSKHKKTKTFKLSVTRAVAAGQTVTILLALPKKALRALSHKAKGSVTFTLAATNGNGIGTATLKISKLKVKKH